MMSSASDLHRKGKQRQYLLKGQREVRRCFGRCSNHTKESDAVLPCLQGLVRRDWKRKENRWIVDSILSAKSRDRHSTPGCFGESFIANSHERSCILNSFAKDTLDPVPSQIARKPPAISTQTLNNVQRVRLDQWT